MEKENKKALLEAALFQSPSPIPITELSKIVGTADAETESLLREIQEELKAGHRGIELIGIDDSWEMRVKGHHAPRVAHLTPHADLSRGLLKVLSLVVYKQPITQSDIVKTIGNRAYEYVKELQERGLIETEKYGRTKRIQVTEHFMSYFGIRSRKELLEKFSPKRVEMPTVEAPLADLVPVDLGTIAPVEDKGKTDENLQA